MGLPGNTVLIYFWSWPLPKCWLLLPPDLHTNKPWQGQHKFWNYVSPIATYFAWLPEQLARTYCTAALDRCQGLPYGELVTWEIPKCPRNWSYSFASGERLRLCCGIQCTHSLHRDGPCQREKLFTAALKLLRFVIGIGTVRCENEAQRALHAALLAWRRPRPGHFERYCADLV